MKKFRSSLIMLPALVLILSGCGKANETKEAELSQESQASTEQTAEEKPAEKQQAEESHATVYPVSWTGSKTLMARM